jgi:DNA-binding transcriptional LysR family regulator
MIAVRIGPDFRFVVVAAPSYFSNRGEPRSPNELTQHNCINLRFPTHGALYTWEFERSGRELNVRVDGQLTFNNSKQILDAVLAGFGVAYLPEDLAKPHLAKKRLVQVLDSWCAPFSGYHLYYPSRRQDAPALSLVVDALRYKS